MCRKSWKQVRVQTVGSWGLGPAKNNMRWSKQLGLERGFPMIFLWQNFPCIYGCTQLISELKWQKKTHFVHHISILSTNFLMHFFREQIWRLPHRPSPRVFSPLSFSSVIHPKGDDLVLSFRHGWDTLERRWLETQWFRHVTRMTRRCWVVTVVVMKPEVVLKAMLVVRRRGDYQPGHLEKNGDFSLTKRKRGNVEMLIYVDLPHWHSLLHWNFCYPSKKHMMRWVWVNQSDLS